MNNEIQQHGDYTCCLDLNKFYNKKENILIHGESYVEIMKIRTFHLDLEKNAEISKFKTKSNNLTNCAICYASDDVVIRDKFIAVFCDFYTSYQTHKN